MRHRLCPRIAHLICLGSCILAVWGCATHPSPAGTPGRHTIAELLRARDPGAPAAPPETPAAEDWQLWTTMKARWPEVEQMLADRHAPLSLPPEAPGHTKGGRMRAQEIREELITMLEHYRGNTSGLYRTDLFRLFQTAYEHGYVTPKSEDPLTAEAIREVLIDRWRPDDNPTDHHTARLIEQVHLMWYEWTYALDHMHL
jgi:hypothetical protein